MLRFSPIVGIGTPLTPHPQASLPPPPPFVSEGRGTLACERGGWESPNSDEGTYTVVLYWTETQYNRCNDAPVKFSTVPAKYFAKVRPVRPSLVLQMLSHGWAGGGGGPLEARAFA